MIESIQYFSGETISEDNNSINIQFIAQQVTRLTIKSTAIFTHSTVHNEIEKEKKKYEIIVNDQIETLSLDTHNFTRSSDT